MMAVMQLVGFALFLVGTVVYADMPKGKYLEGKGSKVAVVLAHGRGLHPDEIVVGPLRRAINKELGFHTLSLQMADPGADSPESPELAAEFPEAYRRIQTAINFLKKEKGVERIYLMGHSMGGRMTSAFLVNYPDAGVVGFIGVGMMGGGQEPVNTNLNLKKVKVPVIDIYADSDPDAKFADFRKRFVSDRYKQVVISGAKHDYRGYDNQVATAVIAWLKQQESAK